MLKATRNTSGVMQNEGWLDRTLRVFAGISLMLLPAYLLEFNFTGNLTWEYYAMLLGIVPMITGMIGWCPLYWLFGLKTCGGSSRNPCGSFPFQLDSALGHHPIPDNDIEHNLEHTHYN